LTSVQPKTSRLIANEFRMLYNQFKQTIRTPSMLLFYVITFSGVFFVSMVFVNFVAFASFIPQMSELLESSLDRDWIFALLGVISVSSVITGYFGLGPAAIITTDDENILLPSPIKPYQLFLSKYFKRIIRKATFVVFGLLAILPLLTSANLIFFSTAFTILCVVLFLESNYFLGALSSYFRIQISKKTKSPFRHLIVILIGVIILVLTFPEFTSTFTAAVLLPSNALGYFLTEATGIFSLGIGYQVGFVFVVLTFLIFLLLTASITNYEYYELFSSAKGKEQVEGSFSGLIRGEIDFSNSRFNDPSVWIMLKDFWSRLRSPYQIWKYIYAFLGTIFIVYLNLFHPSWFPPLTVPNSIQFAIVPAFALMMILFVQMSSITSMLSLVDEKQNVYLLKASPFRTKDIVLAKYLLSLLEVTIAVVPAAGFLIYILRIEGYLALITLIAPLTILFTASGLAIGAYVPVVTNDPKQLPIPLAFSYPIINLALGGLMIFMVAAFADSTLVIIALPVYIIGLTLFFLLLTSRAINSYK